MSEVLLLREQIQDARGTLQGVMEDVTDEQLHWAPPGQANPVAANYAHVVFAEDMTINGMFKEGAPLAASSWAGKTGVSEPPPGQGVPAPWGEWARTVKVDIAALRDYAQAVHKSTDEYLTSLSDEALAQAVDLSEHGLGERTMRWMVYTGLVTNALLHCGEISCLKGLQGVKGFPM